MNKRIAAIVVAALATVGLATVVAGPASATPGTPGCVTHTEWKQQMHKGMTRAQVARKVGTSGRIDNFYEGADGTKTTYVNFRQCKPNGKPASQWNYVFLSFDNYRYDRDYNIIWQFPARVDYKGSWSSVV